ncbi:MAG: type II toxin-antitoxin system prevent-host-death family antitoxin [Acidobacteria bacterium]|nr:type II toxin-antitoxin system prevent-host-death family antitoxin [Acidobacteriota bacterium]
MSLEVSYSEARNNLASLLDQVTEDSEVVVIKRRGRSAVAMIDADELASLLETDYLFRSPKNAARLNKAIEQTIAGKGEKISIEELRKKFGAEKRKAK